MEKKRCACCNRLRPVSAFNRKSSAPDGLQPYCKKCQHDWRMARKADANPEDELMKSPTFDPLEYTGAPHPKGTVFSAAPALKTSELVAELKERGYHGAIFNPSTGKFINI